MANKTRGRKSLSEDELALNRAKIVYAARNLFAQQGYQSISMRALALSLHMSPTSLYRFFPNKRAILLNIWEEVFACVFKECKSAANEKTTPQASLIAYAECFVGFWIARPDTYIMVYGEIDTPQKGESFFADSTLIANEFVYLSGLVAEAGVAIENIELVLQQFICILHGVCHSLVTIPELKWSEAGKLTAGIIVGLLPKNL